MRLYYVGRGCCDWRDARNWSRSSGGLSVRKLHARGRDILVIEGAGAVDLRGMPHADLEVTGFSGRLCLPDGRRVDFRPATRRRQKLWRRLRPSWEPRGAHAESWLGRVLRARGLTWQDAVRAKSAALVSAGQARLYVVVPVIAGGASTWFWVGGTGTWDNATTTHWAASTGGAGGAGVPIAGDTVTFDASSGLSAGTTVTANTSVTLAAINWTSGPSGTATLSLSQGLNCTGTLSWGVGILNTNNFACSWGTLSSSNGVARTLTLGSSQITLTGTNTSVWNTTVVGNLVVTANTAVITMSGTGATFVSATFNFNGMSLVFSGPGIAALNGGSPNTFANITRTGTAIKTDGFQTNGLITCTGTCTLAGGSTQGVNRLFVQSNTIGSQRTITAAAYVINGDVDFQDINLAYSGAASWTNAGSAFIGDCQGNAGAVTTNATVSATQTATNTASTTWSAMTWTSRVPLPQDDVLVSTVSGTPTFTMDMPRLGRTLDFSGTSVAAILSFTSVGNTVFGGLTIPSTMGTPTGTFAALLAGRGSYTINVAKTLNNQWGVNSGGTYTLAHDLTLGTANGNLVVTFGTFDAAGFAVTCRAFSVNATTARTVKMGGGLWTLNGTGVATLWTISNTGTLTFVPSTSTITFAASDSSVKTFAGGGLTYFGLQTPAASNINLMMTGNNTFTNLDLECTTARMSTLPASGTQTVTGQLTLLGASGQSLSLVSSSPGTATTIVYTGTGGANATIAFTSASADILMAPIPETAPVASQSGLTFSTTDGTWDSFTAITPTYQWQQDGVNMAGQTTNTLTSPPAGHVYSCVVTETNNAGATSASSNSVNPVPVNLVAPVATG